MYKIVYQDQTNYDIFETTTFQKVEIDIDSKLKLFNNDSFNLNGEITHSPVRINKYNAGILDLAKTYGKDGKFLYLCKPDDKRLPYFLIPYSIPVTFMKNIKQLYVTFEYIHWLNELPRGSVTQNLGCVNDPTHYYEYMLYCKSLNVSIQSFTKNVVKELKQPQHSDLIQSIIELYSIPIRNDNIFTIDTNGSIDLDDAISISGNIISIYITHVPIILEHLQIWESFTNRISTIYLPDKKRTMLPAVLSQLCSLNKGQIRICIAMDLNMDTQEYSISLCSIKITENYNYDSELSDNVDYQKIKQYCKCKNANDVISKLMILFNTNSALSMQKYKNGIYKRIQNETLDFIKKQSSLYELYDETAANDYLHITSPIRRLIDILNMYKLSMNENLFIFKEKANTFYLNWLNQLEYINTSFRNIRKVQSKCKILSIFEKEKHRTFKGIVYDKLSRTDHKYQYQVFITELNIACNLTIQENLIDYQEYMFKLFVFHDEAQLKKKVKIQLINI